MWQLFVLGSLALGAGESIVDKVAMVAHHRIDPYVATFWRIVLFTFSASIVGFLGFFGSFEITFAPLVFLIGLTTVLSSLAYTYLLKRLEITSIIAFFYLAPFLFLYIDAVLLKQQFSPYEIAGIFLMVLGGVAFAIDGKSHRLKKEFSWRVWCIIAFVALYTGFEAYVFKYLFTTTGISAVSFYVTASIIAAAALALAIAYQRKLHLLFAREARGYIPQVFVSKSFDAGNSLLWMHAITLASVSQVTAMSTLEPLMLFICTAIVQTLFGWRVNEKFGLARVEWKAACVSMLVIGGLLIG